MFGAAAGALSSTAEWIWKSEYWLPTGYNWTDLENPNPRGINYPEFQDLLYYPLPFAVALLCIRFLFERTIAAPFGKWLGISERKKFNFSPNPILEKAFKVNSRNKFKLSGKEFEKLATQSGLEVRQVERWFRKRTILQKPSTLKKFSETLWRLAIYMTTSILGAYTLWNKAWFWDIKECWREYPHHSISTDIWWHYMLGASLYCSLMCSQFFDRARKDFWEMFLHHIVTLILIGFSFLTNLTRVGTVILLLHDVGDVILEAGKCSNYAGKLRVGNVLFGVFTVVWIITRLYIFPAHILRSINVDAPQMLDIFPIFKILNVMLTTLFCIQLFWTWYIMKMVIKALSLGGTVEKDARSSSDPSMSESEDNGKSLRKG